MLIVEMQTLSVHDPQYVEQFVPAVDTGVYLWSEDTPDLTSGLN
jgi:hypothetical protein